MYHQISPIIQNKLEECAQTTVSKETIETVLEYMFPDPHIIHEAAERKGMSVEQFVAETPDFYRPGRYTNEAHLLLAQRTILERISQ